MAFECGGDRYGGIWLGGVSCGRRLCDIVWCMRAKAETVERGECWFICLNSSFGSVELEGKKITATVHCSEGIFPLSATHGSSLTGTVLPKTLPESGLYGTT